MALLGRYRVEGANGIAVAGSTHKHPHIPRLAAYLELAGAPALPRPFAWVRLDRQARRVPILGVAEQCLEVRGCLRARVRIKRQGSL
jgi:hypothetical protein